MKGALDHDKVLTMARLGRRAIVIGAGMGGLLASRALADHYDEVTILERDAIPEADEPRSEPAIIYVDRS
jgi:glycine/D-amino acid oxidase-like deaminating enzyme